MGEYKVTIKREVYQDFYVDANGEWEVERLALEEIEHIHGTSDHGYKVADVQITKRLANGDKTK